MLPFDEALAKMPTGRRAVKDRLVDMTVFGRNPGNLHGRIYRPADVTGPLPLVVVLHGCTQTAAGYDYGAGWSALADELGFMVLFPEQKRANNPNLCFNWFQPADIRRDEGEALSINQMISSLVDGQQVDPSRVFITGLSAGGAMASVMLATYPELFAGGAIIAGLPYGVASGVPQALERMNGKGLPGAEQLGELVRGASMYAGVWPAISVWHGDGDRTVSKKNADAIVDQWLAVHRLTGQSASEHRHPGFVHRVWRDGERVAVEQHMVIGMGHGTPLATSGAEACGAAGPFMLNVGISSTRRIADAWGLGQPHSAKQSDAGDQSRQPLKSEPAALSEPPVPALRIVRPSRLSPDYARPTGRGHNVGRMIEDALRAAGLLR